MDQDCFNTSKLFEFMIKKTHDPEERFSRAVKFFAYEHYNNPKNFDGSFTATLPFNSDLIRKILKKKKYIVEFFERDTGFYFPVYISKLKKTDTKWIYTFWHNSFFNSELNNNIDILYFSHKKKGQIKKLNQL